MHLSKYDYPDLLKFVEQIRGISGSNKGVFNTLLGKIVDEKKEDKSFKHQLSEFTLVLVDQAFFVNAFADYGIHSNRGFFPETMSRLKHKILPPNLKDNELGHFIYFLFYQEKDYVWLDKINDHNWESIFNLIFLDELQGHSLKISQQIHNAIIILSHRLTTIGIDPYLVNKMPEIDDSNSPFFELNHQVSLFIKKHMDDQFLEIDYQELRTVLQIIDTCEAIFHKLESKKDEFGTSLHQTFLMKAAQQHIDRIRLLLRFLITKDFGQKVKVSSRLIIEMVKAEQTKNSVITFVRENTNLLAYRIVSHTSQKGEGYIGFSNKENYKLFYSAMGGGLVVVFLVYIKFLIHELKLSLFFEGFLFGLNYGIGFVLMHLMHLTLATKQPAMTASYIAASVGNEKETEVKPWFVFKQIIRSQIVSLVGNLLVVLPLCFLSAWLLRHYFGFSIFNTHQALTQLYANHPLYSASLIYACFTGFFLSLSGIIIGYFDNKVVYSEVSERILKHPKFKNLYTYDKRKKIASFIERHLGAIIGNLFLGFCLGMAGDIGKFIGVPFDIRHITISAGNFGISLGSEPISNLYLIFTVFGGVILIGLVNIASSFLISFIIACQSRNLSWKQSFKILVGISK